MISRYLLYSLTSVEKINYQWHNSKRLDKNNEPNMTNILFSKIKLNIKKFTFGIEIEEENVPDLFYFI
ncbi:hypothetical protein BpHYR1_002303 [Brachionus plicatilis]|uniref:Uncharacterized protein n=1 Tax=Brachionus plicatilis TaxID=10195 RepID=A0A3M7QDH8_BRAPC|nr:hypothetical protein BpHYR1_002303 [Brachionus plicatilis]